VLLVKPPLCPLCGQPQATPGRCARCERDPLRIDGIRSVALFEGSLRRAIHSFKYEYARDLALPLGEMLVAFWQETPLPADAIVPVPLHRRRLRERGYNQAALLAGRLGQATGVPVLYGALSRRRYTVSQTQLAADQRRRNVEGAFVCVGSQVRGRRALLIDDVCTTGATLEASSVALQEGGARSVWALTLARAH
jgi:ComF family protein